MSKKEDKKLPLIRDFTKPELDMFRELCNFTDEELTYFNLRAQDKSNTVIAQKMYISEPKVSYELNEITQEAVQLSVKTVCREIKEFLATLYGNTDTQLERDEIKNMLKTLNL
jgi:hypothetical protein